MLATVALASFVTFVLAVPTAGQASPSPCAQFLGGFDTASNFTLAALNRTLPNANSTGSPLSLSLLSTSIGGDTTHALSSSVTQETLPGIPSFSLVKGRLSGVPPNAQNEISGGAASGSEVTFVHSLENPPVPARVYCAVASTDPAGGSTGFPALALQSETDLFSLCMNSRSQNNVVFNATANNSDHYIFETCYAVTLQLIGLPK